MARRLRLDPLIRQSQDSGESARSPDQQREAISRWADGDGAEVLSDHEHLGIGRSGKHLLTAWTRTRT